MARVGVFAGPTEEYGLPLSFVHPPDNDFAKAFFHPSLLDKKLKLTDEQRRRLQDEIDALFGVLQIGSDL